MATATLDGGGKIGAKAFGNVVLVDDVITLTADRDGTNDVSAKVQAMINAAPDSTLFVFTPGRVYRCEKNIVLTDRNNIMFLGSNGVTFKSTLRAPNDINFTGAVTAGSQIITSTTPVFGIFNPANPARTVFAWYVSGFKTTPTTSLPRVSVGGYISDTQIKMDTTYASTQTGTFAVRFRSPADRNRTNFDVLRGVGITFRELHITGANINFAGYDVTLEAQHCINFLGSQRFEVVGCELEHTYGDGISVNPSVKRLSSGRVFNNHIHNIGRQGMTLTGYDGVEVNRNIIEDCNRHIFDVEPADAAAHVLNTRIWDNDLRRGGLGTLAISAYLSLPMRIEFFTFDGNRIQDTSEFPIGGNHFSANQPYWGPFVITNNVATVPFATGTPGNIYTSWPTLATVIKFVRCRDVTVTGNKLNPQGGEGMHGVWIHNSIGIVEVHDNDMSTANGLAVSTELNITPALVTGAYSRLGGGGAIEADSLQFSVDAFGIARLDGGGVILATAEGDLSAIARLDGGGAIRATGSSIDTYIAWVLGQVALGSDNPGGGSGFGNGPFGTGPFGGT